MNPRHFALLFLFAALALLLGGCATVTAPRSENDTLLMIPVTLDRSAAGSWDGNVFWKYAFTLKSVQEPNAESTIALDPRGEFAHLQGLPPGDYVIEKAAFMETNGKVLQTWDIGVKFNVPAGRLTILPFVVVHKIKNVSNMYSTEIAVAALAGEKAQRLMSLLKEDEILSKWQLSEQTQVLLDSAAADDALPAQTPDTQ